MSFSISGIRILSFASIIRYMTYCVKFKNMDTKEGGFRRSGSLLPYAQTCTAIMPMPSPSS